VLEPEEVVGPIESASAVRLGTEKAGLDVLLEDPRMQAVSLATKKRILELLQVAGAFKTSSFDAVMTTSPVEPLTETNVADHINQLKLVEMKTTRAAIANASLNRFFFGATDSEFVVARALKERYVFAFVVLNDVNEYERHFFVLLTYEQLQARVRTSRVQYQINFRSDMEENAALFPNSGVGPDAGGGA